MGRRFTGRFAKQNAGSRGSNPRWLTKNSAYPKGCALFFVEQRDPCVEQPETPERGKDHSEWGGVSRGGLRSKTPGPGVRIPDGSPKTAHTRKGVRCFSWNNGIHASNSPKRRKEERTTVNGEAFHGAVCEAKRRVQGFESPMAHQKQRIPERVCAVFRGTTGSMRRTARNAGKRKGPQ